MNKIKKLFLLLLLVEMVFSYAPAFAQTTPSNTTAANAPTYTGVSSQIEQYLCSPNSTTGGNPLFQCINQLYKFAIVLASVIGVFFIVIAGYIYMSADGNNESVDKAKSILTSTITSIVILLAGFVLLKALNPDLATFNNIQPPSVSLVSTGTAPVNVTGGSTSATYPNGIPVAGTAVPGKSAACTVDTTFTCNQGTTTTDCAQYASSIQQYAGMINDPNVNGAALLKTIMYHESRCKNGLTSGQAYGLMQMVLSTANNQTLKAQCGVTATIDANWFNSNPGPSICLSAAYLNLLAPKCGSDAGLLLSAYANGNCSQTAICPLAVQQMLNCYNP